MPDVAENLSKFYEAFAIPAESFARDTLDYQSKELATISALASLAGTGSQLRSHLNVSLNVGLTEAQMKAFISVLNSKVGQQEAENASQLLAEVLSSRPK